MCWTLVFGGYNEQYCLFILHSFKGILYVGYLYSKPSFMEEPIIDPCPPHQTTKVSPGDQTLAREPARLHADVSNHSITEVIFLRTITTPRIILIDYGTATAKKTTK